MLCAVCQKKTETTCSLCRLVYYCSRDCQKLEWKCHKKWCNSFNIKKDDEELATPRISRLQNMSFVATKDLYQGACILEELPLFYIPGSVDDLTTVSDLPKACHYLCVTCGTNWFMFPDKKKCPRCKWPVCPQFGKDCEKHKIHAENECGILSSNKIEYDFLASGEDGQVLFICRAEAVKENKPDVWDELMMRADEISMTTAGQSSSANNQEESWTSKLKETMDKLNSRISNENIINNMHLYKKLFHLLKLTSISDRFGNPMPNSWGNMIQIQEGDYLYPLANYFSRSCAPNCNFAVGNHPHFKVSIRAARDIKKGEELTIHHSISDLFRGTIERRKIIQDKFGYLCRCVRCSDPTEFGTFFSGIVCKDCRPHAETETKTETENQNQVEENVGYFLPLDPESKSESTTTTKAEGYASKKNSFPLVQCNGCKTTRLYSFFQGQLNSMMNELSQNYGDALSLPTPTQQFAEIEKRKNFLAKYSGKFLHPNHFILYLANFQLSQIYGSTCTIQNTSSIQWKMQMRDAYAGCASCSHICESLQTKLLGGALMDFQAYLHGVIGPALHHLACMQAETDGYKIHRWEREDIIMKLKMSIKSYKICLDFYTRLMPAAKPKVDLGPFAGGLKNADDMLRQFVTGQFT